jgi:transglutaminase-like putative cysteine protease
MGEVSGAASRADSAASAVAAPIAESWPSGGEAPVHHGHRSLRLTLFLVSVFLLVSIAACAWTAVWEYSTRRYLSGFADAIVPESASPEQKIQAILGWLAHPPARIQGEVAAPANDRDPVDALNYKSLLRVCGTATNAFINLANSAGLPARRILLLDSNGGAKHVDAEVRVDGRWVVVDPTFHIILRGADGEMLTSRELADPAVFSSATQNIPRYDSRYSFERTAHVRLAALGFLGNLARRVFNFLVPGWEDSVAVSLILERKSLLAMIAAMVITLILILLRFSLRWYGRKRLLLHPVRLRRRLRHAYRAFFSPVS